MSTSTEIGIKLFLQGANQFRADMRSVQAQVDQMATSMRSVAGLLGGTIAIGSLMQAADAVTSLNNQLKLASGSATEAQKAYEGIFQIAQRAGVSLTDLGRTYASIASSTKELGLAQSDMLRVTESIANAMTITGGAAESMNAGLAQFGQALASGKLSGDELRSVLEQIPRLAQAIADGMGVSTGKLREMGQAGQLSAQAVIAALQSQHATLAAEVQNSTATVGQGLTRLQNAFTNMVGNANQATGATAGIGKVMTLLADNMGLVGAAATGLGAVMVGRLVASMGMVGLEFAKTTIASVRAQMAVASLSAAIEGAGARSAAAMLATSTAARGLSAALALVGGPVGLITAGLGIGAAAFLHFRAEGERAAEAVRDKIDRLTDSSNNLAEALAKLPLDQQRSEMLGYGEAAEAALARVDQAMHALVSTLRNDTAGVLASFFGVSNSAAEETIAKLRQAAQEGRSLSPILEELAQRLGVAPEKLQSWVKLAGAVAEAGEAARAAGANFAALQGQVAQAQLAGPTLKDVEDYNKLLLSQSDAVLKATESYKSQSERMAEVAEVAKKIKAEMAALEKQGLTQESGRRYAALQERLKGVQERMNGIGRSAQRAAGGVKKTGDVLEKFNSHLKSTSDAAADAELALQDLGQAHTALHRFMRTDEWAKLTEAQKQQARAAADAADARIRAAHMEQKHREAARATIRTLGEHIHSVHEQIKAQERANAALGKTPQELARLEAGYLRAEAAAQRLNAQTLQGFAATEQETATRQALAQALEQQADAMERGAQLKATHEAMQQLREQEAKDWEETSKTIGDTLADYIMGGGKNAAQYLKRLFSTLVLQPIVRMGAGTLAGALGFASPAAAGQGALGSVGGSLSSLGNLGLLAKLGNLPGGLMTGIKGALGLMEGGVGGAWSAGLTALKAGNLSGGLGTLGGIGAAYGAGFLGGRALGGAISGGYSAWGNSGNRLTNIGSLAGAFFGPIGSIIGGAIAGAVNRLFGRKLKDTGLEGRYSAETGFEGSQYRFYKGGLFRSDKTVREAMDAQMSKPIASAFDAIVAQVGEFAQALGREGEAIKNFTFDFKISGQGKTEEQIAQELQKIYADASAQAAERVLGNAPALMREGESAMDTLARLATSLTQVNAVFSTLGHTLYEASLAGGDMASQLLDAFGGLDVMQQAASAYLESYYDEQEKVDLMTQQLTAQFQALGHALPQSKQELRGIIEGLDLTSESGRKTYAQLLKLAGPFAQFQDALDALAEKFPTIAMRIEDAFESISADGLKSVLQKAIDEATSADGASELARAGAQNYLQNTLIDAMLSQVSSIIMTSVVTPLVQAATNAAAIQASAASTSAAAVAAGGSMAAGAMAAGGAAAGGATAAGGASAGGSMAAGGASAASSMASGGASAGAAVGDAIGRVDSAINDVRSFLDSFTLVLADPGVKEGMGKLTDVLGETAGAVFKIKTDFAGLSGGGGGGYGGSYSGGGEEMRKAAESLNSGGSQLASMSERLSDTVDKWRLGIIEQSENGRQMLRAQFDLLTAQARGGDQSAAGKLSDLASRLIALSARNGDSVEKQVRLQYELMQSMDATAQSLAALAATMASSAGGERTLPGRDWKNFQFAPGLTAAGSAQWDARYHSFAELGYESTNLLQPLLDKIVGGAAHVAGQWGQHYARGDLDAEQYGQKFKDALLGRIQQIEKTLITQAFEAADHYRWDGSALNIAGEAQIMRGFERLQKLRAEYGLLDSNQRIGAETLLAGRATDAGLLDYLFHGGNAPAMTHGIQIWLDKVRPEFERLRAELRETVTPKAVPGEAAPAAPGGVAGGAAAQPQDMEALIAEAIAAQIAKLREPLERRLEQLLGKTDALRKRELDAMEESLRPLQQRIWAIEDERAAAKQAADAMRAAYGSMLSAGQLLDKIDEARGGAGNRYSLLHEQRLWAAIQTASYDKQIQMAEELSNLVLARHQAEKSAAETQLSFARSLKNYVDGLKTGNLSPLTMGERLAEASRQYSAALVKAQGGDKDAQGQLQGLSSTFLDLARTYWASSSEYTAIFNRVTDELSALGLSAESIAQQQLNVSGQALASLQSLEAILSGAYSAAEADYQAKEAALGGQLEKLADIEGGIGTVSDILQGLPAEIAAHLGHIVQGFDANASAIRQAYRDVLGREADEGGLQFYRSQMSSGRTIEDILRDLQWAKLHGSHAGGLGFVPFDGYRAELHQGERVLTRADNQIFSSIDWKNFGRGNEALVAEVRALRQQVAQLESTVAHTGAQQIEATARSSKASAEHIVNGVGQAQQRAAYAQQLVNEGGYR